jgi:hypothetical protein
MNHESDNCSHEYIENWRGRYCWLCGEGLNTEPEPENQANDLVEPEGITINIFPHSEGGFQYDIYDKEMDSIDEEKDLDAYEGGICTSDRIEHAVQMAYSDVRDMIIRRRYNIK